MNGKWAEIKTLVGFVILAVTIGISFGVVQSTASKADERSKENSKQVVVLKEGVAAIKEGVKYIQQEQKEVKDDIKTLLREMRRERVRRGD